MYDDHGWDHQSRFSNIQRKKEQGTGITNTEEIETILELIGSAEGTYEIPKSRIRAACSKDSHDVTQINLVRFQALCP
jgi:hypothetical protein